MVNSFMCAYYGNLQLSRSILKMRSDKTRDYFILSYVVLEAPAATALGKMQRLVSEVSSRSTSSKEVGSKVPWGYKEKTIGAQESDTTLATERAHATAATICCYREFPLFFL